MLFTPPVSRFNVVAEKKTPENLKMAPQSSSDINQVFRKPPEIRNGLKPVVIYTLYAVELAVHKTFSGLHSWGFILKRGKT